jgi:hypothetical protein
MKVKLTDLDMYPKTIITSEGALETLARETSYSKAECSNGDEYFRFIPDTPNPPNGGWVLGSLFWQVKAEFKKRGLEMPVDYDLEKMARTHSLNAIVEKIIRDEKHKAEYVPLYREN